MNGRDRSMVPLGFEPFGAAVGLALVSGALAILVPYLALLTGTLAALAVAGWAVGRRSREIGAAPRPRGVAAATVVGGAAVVYLDPPAVFDPYRSLALALALALLWWSETHALGRFSGRNP